MSEGGRETIQNRLHVTLALLCAWLILTSPWIAMLRRMPSSAGFLDYAHVVVGALALTLALPYAFACMRGGRWRNHFPWVVGDVRPLARDVAGLLRGRLPSAEGGGLFAVIEGLLLAALLLVAITGAGWWFTQGSGDALVWREAHVVGARVLIGLTVAHVVAVATHLFELA
ncbi:MAG TPA: cytochrome b/b6 domain-containing protein [Steroidobacteraceae bacterium]|nr:cytochrome b/b6 domain-containing protein [Steroidobacteraceae bacterium]